jgi:hypothetical protein
VQLLVLLLKYVKILQNVSHVLLDVLNMRTNINVIFVMMDIYRILYKLNALNALQIVKHVLMYKVSVQNVKLVLSCLNIK